MHRPDILVFMSDQHNPVFSSFAGGMARTPNLEKLCEEGTAFTGAYTACPLCVPARISMLLGKVPARISMLLGKMPSKTGVLTNDGAIPESSATFLHSLVAAGYETVLIGRMHFVGINQRHGFTKRLVGDMTPVTWNRPVEKLASERGVFRKCYAEPGCITVIGGGDSPVLEYDKEVIKAALDYLSTPHEKPQCIFVSTYGPHFPYVAPEDTYLYYKDKVNVPESFCNPPEYLNPLLKKKMVDIPEETVKMARAAYFGMIETMDMQLGLVRNAFNAYTEKWGREGFFAYISDHGDTAGERKMFGKKTFFESSVRIPMMMEGKSIKKGFKVNIPVSIMDIGPTLCEVANTNPPPEQDGKSLFSDITGNESEDGRIVMSEIIDHMDGQPVIARMVRRRNFKYITYIGYEEYDLLFDLSCDPHEKENIASRHQEVLKELKKIAFDGWNPKQVMESHLNYIKNIDLVKAWERAVGPDDSERWDKNPEYAKIMPKVM